MREKKKVIFRKYRLMTDEERKEAGIPTREEEILLGEAPVGSFFDTREQFLIKEDTEIALE